MTKTMKSKKADKHTLESVYKSDPCKKCGSTLRFKGSNQCASIGCRKQVIKYATLKYKGV